MSRLEGPREETWWGGHSLDPSRSDEKFYRIAGRIGSGKTHLIKMFVLECLQELKHNPRSKLIVYEPKRQFFQWLGSMSHGLRLDYFLPSDTRSKALDFARDYRTINDGYTLAQAFFPVKQNEVQEFWGHSLRTIFSSVYETILRKLGRIDLRIMCLVLENQEDTIRLLGYDPYMVQAQTLVSNGQGDTLDATARNIQLTIQSRIYIMKILASHLYWNELQNGTFSLRDIVESGESRILAVSRDSEYASTQDPMNGVLFLRLMEILDKQGEDPARKVFVIIDEFPKLAGDNPCPGIVDAFLRLRDRGVVIVVAYQAYTTLLRVYGQHAAESIGQASNVIYLAQSDVDSARYAAEDIGTERGYEDIDHTEIGERTIHHRTSPTWYDRPIYTPTDLMNELRDADKAWGIEGIGKSALVSTKPWRFLIPSQTIDSIPRPDRTLKQYDEWGLDNQRLEPLSDKERKELEL